jgi:thioredoxin reductase
VPDVYAAGDLTPGPQLVTLACAEGVRAALAIHEALVRDELDAGRATRGRPARAVVK